MSKCKEIIEGAVFYGAHILIGVATYGAVAAFRKLCEKKKFYLK